MRNFVSKITALWSCPNFDENHLVCFEARMIHDISSNRWQSSNTDLSDLSILGKCAIFVYQCITKPCDSLFV